MNRIEIKKEARKMIKGNIDSLFFPALVIIVVSIALSLISDVTLKNIDFGWVVTENGDTFSLLQPLFSLVETVLITPLYIGYIIYIKKFLSGKEYDVKDMMKGFKYTKTAILAAILVNVAISFGFVLLVVPGIILSLMYAFVNFVIADGEKGVITSLRKSKELIYGYKWDYFVFNLSYLGWFILGFLTLGVLFVWIIPYFMLGQIMYYQKLKTLKTPKKKSTTKKVVKRESLI